METLTKAGRAFYGMSVIITGLNQMIYSDFRPVMLPPWPAWRATPDMVAWISGVLLIIVGLIVGFSKKGRPVAIALGVVFMAITIFWHLPYILFIQPHQIRHLGLWADASKLLAYAGGAWVVANSFGRQASAETEPRTMPLIEKLMMAGPVCFAITMIEFGIDHVLYIDHISLMVPSWIPGRVFWTYLSAAGLITLGAAIILRIKLEWTALLMGIMIFIWLIVLHIPDAMRNPEGNNGLSLVSAGDALAFSGIALLIALKARRKKINDHSDATP